MASMDRVISGIQSVFDQFNQLVGNLLSPDDLSHLKAAYYQRVISLNPMLKALIEFKNNEFQLNPMEEKDFRNHVKEISEFIQDYYLELRRNILGLPALDIRKLTTAFQDQLEEVGFYEAFDE